MKKYLFITGESHKYEETLQCVEANKDIPDRLEVNEPGGQTGDPCQTHNDSQSMKKYTELISYILCTQPKPFAHSKTGRP